MMEKKSGKWKRYWIVAGTEEGSSSWSSGRVLAENTTLGRRPPMSKHWTLSWSTIGNTQLPQDISTRQTLMPFSIPEPLLQDAAILEEG